MHIELDRSACQGHGRCYALASALFEPDDEGYSVLLVEGEIPAELEDAARLAADNCPEYAITCHPAQS
ncbi:MAG: ferredoxin [Acidimicrobiales bacterium]|nr:ferredoxin [Acidimicrobiales bacterium]